jgi:hypothetical protein
VTRLSLIVVALAAVAACSPTPQTPAQPQVERYGAPTVSAPRDIGPFAPAPCSGPLKAADWRDLGFSPAGAPSLLATGERACAHEGPETERYASVTVVPARDVLVDTYRVRQFALFRPTTIGPLPATIEQSSSDDVSCTVTVGTAADQGFILNYSEYRLRSDGRPDDPCGRGVRVAERIVSSLPPLPGK